MLTRAQSQSSSSATSCASPVSVPWPISERATRMITVSSGLTTTQQFISSDAAVAGAAAGVACAAASPLKGTWNATTRPLVAAIERPINARRDSSAGAVVVFIAASFTPTVPGRRWPQA